MTNQIVVIRGRKVLTSSKSVNLLAAASQDLYGNCKYRAINGKYEEYYVIICNSFLRMRNCVCFLETNSLHKSNLEDLPACPGVGTQ